MTKKVKILFITRKLNYVGATRVLWDIFHFIDREKYQLFLLIDGEKKAVYDDIYKMIDHVYFAPISMRKKLLRKRMQWLANWLGKSKKKKFYSSLIEELQPDMIYFNTNASTSLLDLSKGINIPVICHLHGVGEGILYQGYKKSGEPKKVPSFRMRLTKNVPNYYIACSEACKKVLSEKPYQIEEKDIHVFPESIYAEYIKSNSENVKEIVKKYKTSPDTILIVCTAGFHYRKGPDVLLEAFIKAHAENKNLVFVWVGGNMEKIKKMPFMQKIYKRIDQLQLWDAIHLIGHKDDVYDYTAAADIFMLCSRGECLPLSILEAMRLEIPVIATDVGGISEAIVHEETGLLAESENINQITDLLLRLAASDDLRKQLAIEALRKVESEYDVREHVQHLEHFFSTVVEHSGTTKINQRDLG